MAKCKGTIIVKADKVGDRNDFIFVSIELYGKTFNEVSNTFST